MSAIRSVGIICKPMAEMVRTVVPPLAEWLQARGVTVHFEKQTREHLDVDEPSVEREKLAEGIDLLLVLGGDGTLLSAARALSGSAVPILAVNLGGLGFLTSFTLEEMYPMLELALAGDYRITHRMMLDAKVMRDGAKLNEHCALNDAVANKGALSRMLSFDVYVDKSHVGRYRADGLIVATPTGSTAYSLAAGGPVVQPDLEAFVITPICPHMLTNRPLVVPATATIEVDFGAGDDPAYLTLDGQIGFELNPGDRVVVTKSASRVRFVRPLRKTYYEVLRSKLRWGER
ncbi:MAG TPA: NAD(+)/NADH kinase [Candidatus Acidoferrum sp.]|nr:NAD(+)/NADH kinase [Candidatus Acidoferrum sp.]